MTDGRRVLGASGEAAVAAWYEANGYVVLARNWRSRDGELDLVVRRAATIAFCEVKTRSSTAFGAPAEAVTVAKQQRLRRLAMQWLAASTMRPGEIRFDVAAVLRGEIEVLEAAF